MLGIWLTSRLLYVQMAAADRGLGLHRSFDESWRTSQPVQGHLTASLTLFDVTITLSLALIAPIVLQPHLGTPSLPIWIVAVIGTRHWRFVSSEYAVFQATTDHLLREQEAAGAPPSDTRQDR